METFDGRLRSFNKPKSKSSSSKTAWPYQQSFSANPKSLAEAGFFFKPSKDEPDNVQCFICKKELGGWDEEDNPFEIHVNKCPKCPWAIARCSLEFDVDSDGNFSLKDAGRLPSNKVLEKARLDTFGGKQKWWPHDSVKNHGATSKKMAKAGFVYTPQSPGDDTATCFYCDLSLSGWDAEDDPIEEHQKRESRSDSACHFFQAVVQSSSQDCQETSKATSRKSRSAKQLKSDSVFDDQQAPAKSRSTSKKGKQKQVQSTASATAAPGLEKSVEPLPVQNDLGESEDLEEDDDPILKVKPAPRKSTRKPLSSKPKTSSTRNSKQRMATLSEKDEKFSEFEKPARTRNRSESGKNKEKLADKEKDKPPSNVDGKVAKPYEDTATVDIQEPEGKRKEEKNQKDVARARSRSKSKPLSVADAQAKPDMSESYVKPPLRTKISDIAEVSDEYMEEEEEPEPEPEPVEKQASEPHKQTHAKKAAPLAAAPLEAQEKDVDLISECKDDPTRAEGEIVAHTAGPTPAPMLQPASEIRFQTPLQPPEPTTPIPLSNSPENHDLPSSVNNVDPKAGTTAFQTSVLTEAGPSPLSLFLPPLATSPLEYASRLTDSERAMTVEQWIRHEMVLQHERLRADGERRIEAFRVHAIEVRARIEAL
ncbi:hypothetical protein EW145_g1910 [Phellinidium pouzarii]|uniref:BIR-domain-containing protein n=1 Tax=Phellinidium pouzarii TaxID=167371 RepID=A0A4S4LEF7_9AGAM|nr:hypothetical protein EW145_g1910 [Phellinidium pouzarii]